MNTIILASHGELALGMKQTASVIIGENDNIIAFSAYGEQDLPIKESLIQTVKHHYLNNKIYIVTDILGGSVNTEAMQLTNEFPEITVLSGMNLPLIISLATKTTKISVEELDLILSESRQGIVNCSALITQTVMEEDDL
ncbi:PTS sugar transporter subunit IIA [Enterococcus sp. LJL99]